MADDTERRLDALVSLLHSGLAVVAAGGAAGAADAPAVLMDASAQHELKNALLSLQETNASLHLQLDEARRAADSASRQSATLMNALSAELARARAECAAHQREIAEASPSF
jgi:hypothetical protein